MDSDPIKHIVRGGILFLFTFSYTNYINTASLPIEYISLLSFLVAVGLSLYVYIVIRMDRIHRSLQNIQENLDSIEDSFN